MKKIWNQKGIALVLALVMSLAIMVVLSGVMYFVTESTKMSGATKRYATAQEAADGGVNAVKDAINLVLWGEPVAAVISDVNNCLENAILNENYVSPGGTTFCTLNLTLPGAMGNYAATITVDRLYSLGLPGGRLEFARSASGVSGTAIFFRINSRVTGPGNSTAENSALYRFAG